MPDPPDTTGVGLEVGGSIAGVQPPQDRPIGVTGKSSDSFQDLARTGEGELAAHFHTAREELSSSNFSISVQSKVLVQCVAKMDSTLNPGEGPAIQK